MRLYLVHVVSLALGGILLAAFWVSRNIFGQQGLQTAASSSTTPKPNVIFILTDDQDAHLSSLDYMPFVKKHLLDRGTYFTRHYCTTAVCCPSRVTLWTGKAAHNTNVTDVNPPYGGYPKFISQGYNEKYLPVWLQNAGYNTYYTGKLFNVHTVENYDKPYPAGFTASDFLLDPFTYDYLNSTFQRNKEEPKSYEGEYITDVLAQKAYGLLDEAVQAKKPFFLTIAPSAPHSNVYMNGTGLDKNPKFSFGAPIPVERHKHLFQNVKVPRTANFNPDEPSGANWVRNLPQQNETVVAYNDYFYRSRLQALQPIDELVDGILTRLSEYNLLSNTYIFFSSDNGYHIGQHRLQPGKSCGYEEDINIPLIVRGPGVGENMKTDLVTTHTDLAPTFFQVLGIDPEGLEFDGEAFPITERQVKNAMQQNIKREHINVEYWGFAAGEGIYDFDLSAYNNTYKSLRIIGEDYDLYYSVWCNNEHELYNMKTDPQQLHNLYPNPSPRNPPPHSPSLLSPLPILLPRLDALLLLLKTCTLHTCTHPYHHLHPSGTVQTLKQALSAEHDDFYNRIYENKSVGFDECRRGYEKEFEGAMWDGHQDGGMDGSRTELKRGERGGIRWEEWV